MHYKRIRRWTDSFLNSKFYSQNQSLKGSWYKGCTASLVFGSSRPDVPYTVYQTQSVKILTKVREHTLRQYMALCQATKWALARPAQTTLTRTAEVSMLTNEGYQIKKVSGFSKMEMKPKEKLGNKRWSSFGDVWVVLICSLSRGWSPRGVIHPHRLGVGCHANALRRTHIEPWRLSPCEAFKSFTVRVRC